MGLLAIANANFTSGVGRLNVVRHLAPCLLLLLVAASPAAALDPNRLITQYAHTAWRIKDGHLPPAAPITQTTDGYIWVGTTEGLMRFDGVKFTLWTPPEGKSLPGRGFGALLGTRDGSLWIGTTGGLAHLKDGRLTNYAPPQGSGGVGYIMEDEDGAVWFTRYIIRDGKGPLCRVKDGELRCFGKEDGVPVNYGLGMARDGEGNIWFGSSVLCRWKDGVSTTYFGEELKSAGGDGVIEVAVGPGGQVWAALDGKGPELGVRHYSGGKWSGYVVPGFNGPEVRASTLYIDRNNTMWVGSRNEGIYRIHDGVADHYGMESGLTGGEVGHIYEDREGNIWVQTEGGIDMFRETSVLNFSLSEGLSGVGINSVLALRDGSVWVSNESGVDIIRPGGASAITALKGLPRKQAEAMLEDSTGRVWLNSGDRLMTYERGRFSEVRKSDGSLLGHLDGVWAASEGADGRIWAGVLKEDGRYLLRIKGLTVEEEVPLEKSIRRAKVLAADPQGGVWIGAYRDKLYHYRDGRMDTVSLGENEVVTLNGVMADTDGTLWVTTSKGLYRWQQGALTLLDKRNGLPCDSLFSALRDNSDNLWLYARCGLIRVPSADMAAWVRQPEGKVSASVFDALDGAFPNTSSLNQQSAAKSADGRLWFASNRAVQMIDPGRDYTNPLPPPVHVEGIVADRRSYAAEGRLVLPPLRGELEINYTALSLAVPRKVRFRYKLEGHDADWQDVGARRQAFYNSLGPGSYTFRVIACNNDGVWNEAGAALSFHIEPTWYQTTAFRALLVLSVALAAWGIYGLRIRRVSRAISARFDERLAERTRLARELHDTLLQTVQGSKLVADSALEHPEIPDRVRRALEQLSAWLGQATEEGRAALNSLRTSTTETNDLAAALRRAVESCRLGDTVAANFTAVGEAREMHPIVRDEIYRIGYEAIRNACQHSKATRLEVELRYSHDLSLRVRDNGVGIDPVLAAEGKEGHYGLLGMRERAARIEARLTINSSVDSGTEVTLVVPGGIVFRKAGATSL